MKTPVKLYRSNNGKHKFMAVFPESNRNVKTFTVHFGLKGFSDYTLHKDKERMKRYLARHAGSTNGLSSRRENWSRSGAKTAGFWSRWLLWSKPSLNGAIKKTEKVLGRKIIFVR